MKKGTIAVCVIAVLATACASQRPAPVVDRSAATKPAPSAETPVPTREAKDGVYTVQRGDTLYSIALAFGIDHRDLARWNGIADPATLRLGQTLRVTAPVEPVVATATPITPGGATEVRPLPPAGGAPAAPITPAAPPAANPAAPPAATPTPPVAVAPTSPPPVVTAAARPDSRPESSPNWQWPAPGKVIESFDDPRNKGIDIAGNEGSPVQAAADGEVVYVGSAVRGYGNLVIVRHTDEFITAYAHNSKVVVQEKQQVKRGQKIAEIGRSDADRPKLHFEVRHQGKPVDPLKYLPAR